MIGTHHKTQPIGIWRGLVLAPIALVIGAAFLATLTLGYICEYVQDKRGGRS
jgi:hypothetical protein